MEKNDLRFVNLTWLFSCNFYNRNVIQMDFDEASALWKTVENTKGTILEIGRRYGGSTVIILGAAELGRKIISIDKNPKHDSKCQEIFKNYKGNLTLLIDDSTKIIPEKFGMLFIDGNHHYHGCSNDILAHWNNLESYKESQPLAIFHDANLIIRECRRLDNKKQSGAVGVNKVCKKLLNLGCAKLIETVGSVMIMEKLKNLPKEWVKIENPVKEKK
jgi:hypothetical protein